jgi:hypothetical protein
MAAMKFCERDADPSLAFANAVPEPRQEFWQRRGGFTPRSWCKGCRGLAAVRAEGWDSMLSPIDVRSLTASQRARDGYGSVFLLDRERPRG